MEEKASIFELDIRGITREFICQHASEENISLNKALDNIVMEWKKSKIQNNQERRLSEEQKQQLIEAAEEAIAELDGDDISISVTRFAFDAPQINVAHSRSYCSDTWGMLIKLSRDLEDLENFV